MLFQALLLCKRNIKTVTIHRLYVGIYRPQKNIHFSNMESDLNKVLSKRTLNTKTLLANHNYQKIVSQKKYYWLQNHLLFFNPINFWS